VRSCPSTRHSRRKVMVLARACRAALAVTPEAIQRVAQTYLTPGRVVLSMVPAGQATLASRPDRPSTNVTPTPEK